MIQSEELKSSNIVLDFLTTKDEKMFHKQLKQQVERTLEPQGLQEYATLSGKHYLTTEPSSFLFCKKFDTYINSTEVLSQKFNSLSSKLSMQLRKVSDTIQSLAETSKHLSTVHKIGRSTDLSDVYKDLQVMLEKWSKYMKGQSKTTHDCLEEYSNYGTLEASSLRELNMRRQNYSSVFMKQEQALLKKKQRVVKGDSAKWELSDEWLA